MQTEHLNAALQDNPDWLPPATALTRYRPPAADSVLAMPAAAEEAVAGFRIGSLGFLLAAGTYCEVLGPLPVAALPNVPAWFSGLLNLRGNLAPVFDLYALLGDAAVAPGVKRYLLAVGRGDKTVVLWIDGLPEMLAGLAQPLQSLPLVAPALQRYINGAYTHAGQLWLNVQYDALFKALGSMQAAGGTSV